MPETAITRDYRIVGGHLLRVTAHPPDRLYGPRRITWEDVEGYITHALHARMAAIPQPWRALNDDYRQHVLDALMREVIGGDLDEAPDAAHREQMARMRSIADVRATEDSHWEDRFRDE
jgi:hypothetical protein